MSYNIKLTIETPAREKSRGRDSFRLRVTASDAVGMPNEIFVANRELVDPDNPEGETRVMLQSICSMYDLSIYPANTAQPGQWPPYFRVSSFDILLPSLVVCDDTVEKIKLQVANLIEQHYIADRMEVVEEVWIPSQPSVATTT